MKLGVCCPTGGAVPRAWAPLPSPPVPSPHRPTAAVPLARAHSDITRVQSAAAAPRSGPPARHARRRLVLGGGGLRGAARGRLSAVPCRTVPRCGGTPVGGSLAVTAALRRYCLWICSETESTLLEDPGEQGFVVAVPGMTSGAEVLRPPGEHACVREAFLWYLEKRMRAVKLKRQRMTLHEHCSPQSCPRWESCCLKYARTHTQSAGRYHRLQSRCFRCAEDNPCAVSSNSRQCCPNSPEQCEAASLLVCKLR
ncbi:uncharacterized protein LOC110392623 [Numida meleagris]|uniref:uncharacterized protein LOC110392623 n=1 Tax=Numida meleagris TaxID=8996 RepID=UPI000B3DCC0F|nr:uncharacterized protein LOC110392623 [Numida meleagris]